MVVVHACKSQLLMRWSESQAGVRHWWLTPGILAIQEAEIRRIMVQSQPGQIVLESLSRKNTNTRKGAGG
jgi:hypothetical protein